METETALAPERLALLTSLANQAAGWWGETVCGALSLANHDNGDPSRKGGMTMVLGLLAASSAGPVSTIQRAAFQEHLSQAILAKLLTDPTPSWDTYYTPARLAERAAEGYTAEQIAEWRQSPMRSFDLHCDYGPDQLLHAAGQVAGIPSSRFPWKTTTWVCWDERPECCYVKVSHGYGRQAQRLPAVGEEGGQS